MEIGHPASRCRAHPPPQSAAAPAPPSRPRTAEAFLPSAPTPLSGRVAKVEVADKLIPINPEGISRGLAGLLGGSAADYRVASFRSPSWTVFFPSWVSRESAIGRSPLSFEGVQYNFCDWVEIGEKERGRLHHLAWIQLLDWPVLCWDEDVVKSAISCFGELWEVDGGSRELRDVSLYRIRVRCQDVSSIPEVLLLTVDDRRFSIKIVVESWDVAAPIFLGENLDQHFGLDSIEAQEGFIQRTGFNSVPGLDRRLIPRGSPGADPDGGPRVHQALVQPSPLPVLCEADFPPLQPYPPSSTAGSSCDAANWASPSRSAVCEASDFQGAGYSGLVSGTSPERLGMDVGSSSFGRAGPLRRRSSAPVVSGLQLTKASRLVIGGPSNLLANRLSPRLAFKTKGIMKSSIHKARDLLRKKNKMVSFAPPVGGSE